LSHKDARVHCAVLKKRAAPHQPGAYRRDQRGDGSTMAGVLGRQTA